MTATLTRKTLAAQVRVKDADQGLVELVFATFNKIDKDGDVTLKGAFAGNPPVVLSAYGHKSWEGALPYGTGVIAEGETEAVAEVKFELDTTHGRDAFLIVKALSEAGLQEWSYSLEDVESERGKFDGKNVRFLKRVFVKEISPVLRGAGTDTRTLNVKSDVKQLDSDLRRNLRAAAAERWGDDDSYVWVQDFDIDESYAIVEIEGGDEYRLVQVDYTRNDDGTIELAEAETDVQQVTSYAPKGASFSEHTTAVMASVAALTKRASEVVALRARKGKSISDTSADLLNQVDEKLQALRAAIDQPAPPSTDELQAAIDAEFLHFVATSQGVTT